MTVSLANAPAFPAPEQVLQTLLDQICNANATGQRLQIRGSGSKDFYTPVTAEAQILDTRSLRGIINYEPSELVVSAWAGTPLAELEAVLAEYGQCLPFEPPHFGNAATVGGMVAVGLAGPSRANVGSVRDHILGVHLINGLGQLLQFGGTVIKNVAGYDVSRLLAGSLGTLGLITQVHLKVLPLAPAQATLRFAALQADALQALYGWSGQPLPLNASSWQWNEAGGVLHVRLRGARAAVEAACQRMGGERLDETAAALHWPGCREQSLPWFQAVQNEGHSLWRLAVPQTTPKLDLAVLGNPIPFIEWHGGQHWIALPPKETALATEFLPELLRRAGGHASLFRPATSGISANLNRFQPLPASLFAIHQRLKQEFDPAGIFPDLPWKKA